MIYEMNGTYYTIRTDAQERSLCSLHGLARVMGRMDLTEKKALQLIERAWQKGLKAEDLPRKKQEYVNRMRRDLYNGATQLRVYEDFLFIFSGEDTLITVYQLPKYLTTHSHFDGNTRVRNLKKYMRMNPVNC